MPENILVVITNKKAFDEIACGNRITEYLDRNAYWKSRLYEKNGKKRLYEKIEFINIENKKIKKLVTEFDGVTLKETKYYLRIGKILEKKSKV